MKPPNGKTERLYNTINGMNENIKRLGYCAQLRYVGMSDKNDCGE